MRVLQSIKPLFCGDPSKSGIQRWKEARATIPSRDAKLEPAEQSDSIGAHRDNVWLAVDSVAVVGGLGLMSAAWLGFIALAAGSSEVHLSPTYNIFGWVLVAAGIYALYWGIRIFRFFRWGRPPLPLTIREQRDLERKAAEVEGRTTAEPKREERARPEQSQPEQSQQADH